MVKIARPFQNKVAKIYALYQAKIPFRNKKICLLMAAIRLRVVSNFGDGDSGMSEIHAREGSAKNYGIAEIWKYLQTRPQYTVRQSDLLSMKFLPRFPWISADFGFSSKALRKCFSASCKRQTISSINEVINRPVISEFRVAWNLFIKARTCAQPLIWKWVPFLKVNGS